MGVENPRAEKRNELAKSFVCCPVFGDQKSPEPVAHPGSIPGPGTRALIDLPQTLCQEGRRAGSGRDGRAGALIPCLLVQLLHPPAVGDDQIALRE